MDEKDIIEILNHSPHRVSDFNIYSRNIDFSEPQFCFVNTTDTKMEISKVVRIFVRRNLVRFVQEGHSMVQMNRVAIKEITLSRIP
jgi:hypothetical protein